MTLLNLLLLASPLLIHASPLDSRAVDETIRRRDEPVSAFGRRVFLDTDTCDDKQQAAINQAWKDAGELARVSMGGRLDYDYSIPMKQWLGKDYNWPGWWPFSSDFRDIILRNQRRDNDLHVNDVGSSVWVYLSCPKQHEECTPGTVAASADQSRIFWKNHFTIFCPIFFTNYPTMSEAMDKVAGNKDEQMVMDNYWGNQGYTFHHETYHYGGTVSQPRCADYCYGAEGCWEMANDQNKGTKWAMENADSYALQSTAIYMQQHFNLDHPPVPRKYYIVGQGPDMDEINKAKNPSILNPPKSVPDGVQAAGTQIYKALNSVPDDLFGSLKDVNILGTNMPSRWKEVVGPAIVKPDPSSSSSAPSSTTTTTDPPKQTDPPKPDMNSDACKSCTSTLGASNCPAPDLNCLHDQCKNDKDCQKCGLDCNTVGGT